MNFSINRASLSGVLATAASVAPTKPTMPVLANVLLRAEKDTVTIAATDTLMTTWATLPADVKKQGALTVDARRLREIVDGMKFETVNLLALENAHCEITAGRACYKAIALPADDFPRLPDAPKSWTEIGPVPFRLLIERTRFAIDPLASIEGMRGAMLDATKDGAMMVGLSRAGLARCESIIGLTDVPAGTVIPLRALKEFTALAAEAPDLAIGFTDRYVYLRRGPLVLGALTTGLAFPPWEKVVPEAGSHDASLNIDAEDLRAALKNIGAFTEEGAGKGCKFEAAGDELHLRATAARAGEGHEVLACVCDGKAINVSLVPAQVAQTVEACGTSRVDLRFYSGQNKPVSIHPVGATDFVGLVMPVVGA